MAINIKNIMYRYIYKYVCCTYLIILVVCSVNIGRYRTVGGTYILNYKTNWFHSYTFYVTMYLSTGVSVWLDWLVFYPVKICHV